MIPRLHTEYLVAIKLSMRMQQLINDVKKTEISLPNEVFHLDILKTHSKNTTKHEKLTMKHVLKFVKVLTKLICVMYAHKQESLLLLGS